MLSKIKNLLSKNKTAAFAVLFFSLLGLTLPLYFARAFLWEGIAEYMFAPIIAIIPAMGNLVLQLAFLILNWVTSDGFISWPYTIPGQAPAGNPLIEVGWTLTRDLSNMFLVIILIIIGLGTALKISEYEIKKTLPRLIMIALLINFTPVIMGVIVDASNIVMNFFLDKMSGFDMMVKTMMAQYSIIAQTMKSGGLLGMPVAIFQAILLFIFDVLAAFVIGLFAALFAMRYVAIWILVILSPIAFISSLLPSTKGFFKTWWTQFIQWSIIGVIAAFFLYLGNYILFFSGTMIRTNMGNGELFQISFSDFIQSITPIGIALIFLIFGFFHSISSAAMGTGGVISFAQKNAKALGSGAWKKAGIGKKISDRASKTWEESGRAKGFRERMTELSKVSSLKPGWGAGQAGAGAWIKRGAAKAVGGVATVGTLGQGATAIRATGRALGSGFTESENAKIRAAETDVEKASVDMVISKFRSAGEWATKIGYMNRLAKKGDMDEAMSKGLKENEVLETMHRAGSFDAHKDILSAMPHLADLPMRGVAARYGISLSEAYSNPHPIDPATGLPDPHPADPLTGFMTKIKPEQAGHISRDALEKPEIVEAIVRSWDGRQIGKFIETHGRAGADKIEERITNLATAAGMTNPIEWLMGRPATPAIPAHPHPTLVGVIVPAVPAMPAVTGHNPRLASYIRTSPGNQFFRI